MSAYSFGSRSVSIVCATSLALALSACATTQKVRPWDEWHREITSPAIWTRQWGKGRIFVCTPGHSLDVLAHPTVHTVIERGLLWAGR